jgi:hypothetical protein
MLQVNKTQVVDAATIFEIDGRTTGLPEAERWVNFKARDADGKVTLYSTDFGVDVVRTIAEANDAIIRAGGSVVVLQRGSDVPPTIDTVVVPA